MVMGFSPLAAQLDAEGKVRYGVAHAHQRDRAITLGVEDYLMAFKRKDNREAVKEFLDLYYQPEHITRWIAAEGFLPVTARASRDGRQPEAQALSRCAAERAPRADHRSRVGPREARRPAEHRPRRPARRRPSRSWSASRRAPLRGGERSLTAALTARAAARRGTGGRGRGGRLPWLGPEPLADPGGGAVPGGRADPRVPSISTRSPGLFQRSVGLGTTPASPAGGAAAVAANTAVWVVGGRRPHAGDLARARPARRCPRFPGPAPRAAGAHRAVGGVPDHDGEALRVDLRLLLRPLNPR